jgi:hypothetical protein
MAHSANTASNGLEGPSRHGVPHSKQAILSSVNRRSLTVNGAGQSGINLVVNAIAGTLIAGDVITINNVNLVNAFLSSVNRRSRATW